MTGGVLKIARRIWAVGVAGSRMCTQPFFLTFSFTDLFLQFLYYDTIYHNIIRYRCVKRLTKLLSLYTAQSHKKKTTGHSNLTKRPHRRRTWTVQSYLPGCTNVHPHLMHASLDLPESTTQVVSRSVWQNREGAMDGVGGESTDKVDLICTV